MRKGGEEVPDKTKSTRAVWQSWLLRLAAGRGIGVTPMFRVSKGGGLCG